MTRDPEVVTKGKGTLESVSAPITRVPAIDVPASPFNQHTACDQGS